MILLEPIEDELKERPDIAIAGRSIFLTAAMIISTSPTPPLVRFRSALQVTAFQFGHLPQRARSGCVPKAGGLRQIRRLLIGEQP